MDEEEFTFSEDLKLDSYVNVLCSGEKGVYYAGGKKGYLVRVSRG